MTASASRRRFLMRLGCISSAAAACSIPTVCAWAAGTHTLDGITAVHIGFLFLV